jgi:hypothetical protein
MQVLMLHNMQPVPPLSSSVANLPIGRAIMRALEKDPQRRFSTAEEFAAALDGRTAAAPAVGAPAIRTGTVTMPALAAAGAAPAAAAANANTSKSHRSGGLSAFLRRYWILLVVAALLAIVAATQLM